MVYGEQSGPEQVRADFNLSVTEAARDSVDALCREMISHCFRFLNAKLTDDQFALEMSGKKLMDVYTEHDDTHAPYYEGQPTSTVSLLLERLGPDDGSEDDATGDKLRVFLPVPETYRYPDPIDENDEPPEMYFEFIPNQAKHTAPSRYIIQRNTSDYPKFRYGIYAYELEPETGKDEVFDAMHDEVLREGLINRIPAYVDLAAWLVQRLVDFKIVPQGDNRAPWTEFPQKPSQSK